MSCVTDSGVVSVFIGASFVRTTSPTGSPFDGRMLHREALVHSKEWNVGWSVQPYVGTERDRTRRSPRAIPPALPDLVRVRSSRAASGEVDHGCRRLRRGFLHRPRVPLRA